MILFSDLHLEEKSERVALDVLRKIPDVCDEHNDHEVGFLGDFFMVRHHIAVRLLVAARDEVQRWFERGVRCVNILAGNHDQFTVDGRNVLEMFDGIGGSTGAISGGRGVAVHTTPAWTPQGFWLPYRRSHDDVRAVLAAAAEKIDPDQGRPSVLFAHLGVLGAWRNNLSKDDDGFPLDELAAFGFKRVFLGHYHRHYMLRRGIFYVGSSYQVSYAEAGQAKGYMTWDGSAGAFHEWKVGPRHHKVTFDADHPSAFAVPAHEPGDKLWLVVKGQMGGAATDAVQAALKAAGIEPARVDVDVQPTTKAARLEIGYGEPLDAVARRYVDEQDIDGAYKQMLVETFNRLVGF